MNDNIDIVQEKANVLEIMPCFTLLVPSAKKTLLRKELTYRIFKNELAVC